MHLIKLDATDSTNGYLRRLLLSGVPEDYTVISAVRQTQGRGQMGTHWVAEEGKNLTFSILRRHLNLDADRGFVLNICVSLAIYTVLKQLQVPDLSIKWPNDILSGNLKICGILIESKIQGNVIDTSIIGIGLNVNQLNFENLENASSLKRVLGRTFDLDDLLTQIVDALNKVFLQKDKKENTFLWDAYESALFKRGMPMTFENDMGDKFVGRIKGVSKDGKLTITLDKDTIRSFDMKEVKLLY